MCIYIYISICNTIYIICNIPYIIYIIYVYIYIYVYMYMYMYVYIYIYKHSTLQHIQVLNKDFKVPDLPGICPFCHSNTCR